MGLPQKLGNPKLEIIHDTLTGRLYYADVLVAVGTMNYKHEDIMCDVSNHYICDPRAIAEKISGTQVNLKLIPDIDGSIAIAQLVAYSLIDIHVKGAWSGHARIATACACECAGSRPAGQENASRPSFHRRSDAALRPGSV